MAPVAVAPTRIVLANGQVTGGVTPSSNLLHLAAALKDVPPDK